MWNREGGSWVKQLATTVEISNGRFHLVLRGNVPTNFIIDLFIIWSSFIRFIGKFNRKYSMLLSKNTV